MATRNPKWTKTYFIDLGERVGATFLEALIPMYITVETVTELDWWHALAVSGSASGLALLKGLYANLRTPESGASILPAPPAGELEKPYEPEHRAGDPE